MTARRDPRSWQKRKADERRKKAEAEARAAQLANRSWRDLTKRGQGRGKVIGRTTEADVLRLVRDAARRGDPLQRELARKYLTGYRAAARRYRPAASYIRRKRRSRRSN